MPSAFHSKSRVIDDKHIQAVLDHVASLGKGKDTILAHINPREVAMLKAAGGKGNTNAATGLMQFDDAGGDSGGDGGGGDSGGDSSGDSGGGASNTGDGNDAGSATGPGSPGANDGGGNTDDAQAAANEAADQSGDFGSFGGPTGPSSMDASGFNAFDFSAPPTVTNYGPQDVNDPFSNDFSAQTANMSNFSSFGPDTHAMGIVDPQTGLMSTISSMFDALANKATNFVGNIGPAGLLGTAVAGPIGGLIGHAADQAMGLTAGQLGGFGNNPSKDSSGFDSFGGNSGSQGGHSGSSSGNSGNANSNSNNSNSPNGPDATANADEAGGSNFDNVTNSANVTGSSSGGGPTQQAGTQFIQQFLQNATNPTASPATVNAMASSANELGMPQSLQFPPLPELADLLSGAKGLAATTSNNSVDASANPNGISKFLPVLAASTASKGGQTQSQADQLQQLLKLLSVGGLNVAS